MYKGCGAVDYFPTLSYLSSWHPLFTEDLFKSLHWIRIKKVVFCYTSNNFYNCDMLFCCLFFDKCIILDLFLLLQWNVLVR